MIEKRVVLKNGAIEFFTNAHDHINDQITFYYHEGMYTDDGYYFNELEISGVDHEKAVKYAKQIAKWFFCEFDDENEQFVCRMSDGLEAATAMIQIATAVSSVIFFKL